MIHNGYICYGYNRSFLSYCQAVILATNFWCWRRMLMRLVAKLCLIGCVRPSPRLYSTPAGGKSPLPSAWGWPQPVETPMRVMINFSMWQMPPCTKLNAKAATAWYIYEGRRLNKARNQHFAPTIQGTLMRANAGSRPVCRGNGIDAWFSLLDDAAHKFVHHMRV